MPVKVIGADKVAAQFAKLGKINNANFINVISQSTLSLLRNNCPVDTGELQRSWTEIYKTNTSVGIGTNDSQVIKLKSILSGTQYSALNALLYQLSITSNSLTSALDALSNNNN